MTVYNYLNNIIKTKGAAHLVLIDPDKMHDDNLDRFSEACIQAGVDGFLYGGSLLMGSMLDAQIVRLKQHCPDLPVILFPGSVNQISAAADALLFLSLISGRNSEHLIGKHVIAAPILYHSKLEPISCGYMLIESGKRTTAEYMSGSSPIPRNKPEIAVATALAGEYLGMKLLYLEAGSGAENPVPETIIKAVAKHVSVPLMVGGGLREISQVRQAVQAGAQIIVTGNHFETEAHWGELADFAKTVHYLLD